MRFAGVVVFSIIGFKATKAFEACEDRVRVHNSDEECSIEKELSESVGGTGLAFIIFTEAINQFPLANLWAILFFLMLFTLGIDSQFGTLEGVISSLVDMKLFPNLAKDKITMVSHSLKVTYLLILMRRNEQKMNCFKMFQILCMTCGVLSLTFANGAGSYIFQLMDSFAGNYTLLIIAFCEVRYEIKFETHCSEF